MALHNQFNQSQSKGMIFAVSEGRDDFRVMTANLSYFERYGDINEAHCFIEAVERLQKKWEVFGKDQFTLADVVKKYQQAGLGCHPVLQEYVDDNLTEAIDKIMNPPSESSGRAFKGPSPA